VVLTLGQYNFKTAYVIYVYYFYYTYGHAV